MPIRTSEFARRVLLRAIARNSEVVTIVDNDPNDTDGNTDLFQVPDGIMDLTLRDVGFTNQSSVEILRADLRSTLVLIDADLAGAPLNPDSVIGTLRQFIRAAMDERLSG